MCITRGDETIKEPNIAFVGGSTLLTSLFLLSSFFFFFFYLLLLYHVDPSFLISFIFLFLVSFSIFLFFFYRDMADLGTGTFSVFCFSAEACLIHIHLYHYTRRLAFLYLTTLSFPNTTLPCTIQNRKKIPLKCQPWEIHAQVGLNSRLQPGPPDIG